MSSVHHPLAAKAAAVSVIGAALFAAMPAGAQSAVKPGGTVRLRVYYAVETNCTSSGRITISMIRDPQSGHLKVEEGTAYPHFLPSNPRAVCNTMQVPVTRVFYVAKPGFTGIDPYAYDVISPLGRVRRVSGFVAVQ